MLKITDLKLNIKSDESELIKIAQQKLGAKPKYFKILKKSLDARDKNNICWIYSLECSKTDEQEIKKDYPTVKNNSVKPVIIGMGPAGLFCAIRLIKCGLKPVIIERGERVEDREKTAEAFFKSGKLNVNSNIQFGEGGAGTFSDGKLNTQTKNPLNKEVLETFVEFGAPQEILYLSKPHIGSDKLKLVIKNMREYIINNGGTVLFNTKFIDFKTKNDKIYSVVSQNLKTNEIKEFTCDEVVLAIGHSSRDTFELLNAHKIDIQQKDFAVGFRIEHLQKDISYSQYGKNYALLPPADYKLVSHASERAVFTFCMCPGGFVIPSASEEGMVVTNGMSNYLRNNKNSNSAIIAQITKSDFASDKPLSGVDFQREIEKKAFILGGENYNAPVQKVGDFLKNKPSNNCGAVVPSFLGGVKYTRLNDIYPQNVTSALQKSIVDMERRLKGFSNSDAVLTGVETRTSSPVRIVRDENLQSVSVKGLYPCGEGCGYAGGITSASADGIMVANKIIEKYI